MRLRRLALLIIIAAAGATTACAPSTPSGTTPPPTSAGSRSATGGAPSTTPAADPPRSEPPVSGGEYKVTYGLAVPSGRITINHDVKAPIAAPPAPPLPYLVGIYVGDHPEGDPKYARISFYFRGAFPSYNFEYVHQVLTEAQGDPITLEGNAYIRLGFVDAQAHNDAGNSTVKVSPAQHIGFKNLKSYGFAGDFEGHLTYGLGVQLAANSDQVLALRTGELKKPDGSGGFFYVVHLDVRNG